MPIDNIEFPSELAYGSSGGPQFNTIVTKLSSGFEGRQQQWERAMLQYDAAPAIHDEQRLATLLKFFYARKGRARGFKFLDRMDFTSNPTDNQSPPTNVDQIIGTGNGVKQTFQLKKIYSDSGATYERDITQPVTGTVVISLNNVAQPSGWTLNSLGQIFFSTAPAAGVIVKAGFEFRVPVRFDTDFLDTSIDYYQASVPIVELREV
jgi:uncharacterized protein (TIGR02217 family)